MFISFWRGRVWSIVDERILFREEKRNLQRMEVVSRSHLEVVSGSHLEVVLERWIVLESRGVFRFP